MLFVNYKYESLNRILTNIVNETKDSDKFESKCAKYLRKQFPDHKFTVKGGSNNQVSDILVDNKFYIECKMTENGNKKNGAQSTGFGIKLVSDNGKQYFECSETASDNESAKKILKYINDNVNDFISITEPHSKTVDLEMNKSIFAKWISEYYKNKKVKFFITSYNKDYIVFSNTANNILKYFNISATARYYSYGSKNLPISSRDEAIAAVKKKIKVKSVRYDKNHTYITIKDDIDSNYIEANGFTVYLSNKNQAENEYRLMKLSDLGTSRILFSLHTKREQDPSDLAQFEKYLNK